MAVGAIPVSCSISNGEADSVASIRFKFSFALDDVVITEKMQAQQWDSLDEIVKKIPKAFTDEVVKIVESYEPSKPKWLQFI